MSESKQVFLDCRLCGRCMSLERMYGSTGNILFCCIHKISLLNDEHGFKISH